MHDRRRRGPIHPAYLWAGGAFVVLKVIEIPIGATLAWRAVATVCWR